jgi:replicative DNA helicase
MTADVIPMERQPDRASLMNIEAEMGLLGAILLDDMAMDRVAGLVAAEDFVEPLHARLFEIFTAARAGGNGITPILVAAQLSDNEAFEQVGGVKYLASLAQNAVPHATEYARYVRDLAHRRDIVDLCAVTIDEAHRLDLHAGASDIAAEHLSALHEVVSVEDQGAVSWSAAAVKALEREERAASGEDENAGAVKTGLVDLDKIIVGLPRSELSVIGARPAMGKTSLALSIALHAAKSGLGTLFFSLEMDEAQLMSRILSIQTGTSADLARRGALSPIDTEVRRGMAQTPLPIIIDPTSAHTVATIAGRARSVSKRRDSLGLVVVDHLALVRPLNPRSNQMKVYEVAENTMMLKALAKDLEVPVLLLHQLSRAVESRDDKRPMLSDLRDSGSIEQDAAVVTFLYREEEYYRRTEPTNPTETQRLDWEEGLAKVRGKAELSVAKNRFGPANRRAHLQFDAESTAFRNLAR